MSMIERSDSFRRYERLLVQLAQAMAARPRDEALCETISEQMDESGFALSREELALANDISGDLYMLESAEVFEPAGMPEPELARRILVAYAQEEWATLLDLLRHHCAAVRRPEVAYIRARAYEQLKAPMTAWAFMDFAAKIDSGNPNLAAMALERRWRAGDIEGAVQESTQALKDPSAAPRLKVIASTVLIRCQRRDELVLADWINALRDALLNEEGSRNRLLSVIAGGYGLLGMLLADAGDNVGSMEAFSRYLRFSGGPGIAGSSRAAVAAALARNTTLSQAAQASLVEMAMQSVESNGSPLIAA